MIRKILLYILLDLSILLVSITLSIWILPITYADFKAHYCIPLGIFILLWMVISFLSRKTNLKKYTNFKSLFINILWSNLLILIVLCIILFASQTDYSRSIALLTIALSTTIELFFGYLFIWGIKTHPSIEKETLGTNSFTIDHEDNKIKEVHPDPELVEKITDWVGETSKDFILKNIAHKNLLETLFVSTTTRFNIDHQKGVYQNIVNLKRINDIQRINKFFESVNQKLLPGGIFIDCVETYELRKQRILAKYLWGFNYIIYSLDFIIKRIFPKLVFTKGIYFFLTRGQNRVMSKAETFGRLYSCGFKIYDEALINRNFYFAAQKIKEPAYDLRPTYGPFIKLRRVGKNGKVFNVFKLRTMHPYAEYLQQYVHDKNNLAKGGKFKNDFRVNTVGKFFRKFWLDEIPMLFNWLKGDLKLVGVRPLSMHYYKLYSKELQKMRIKYKPGLFPPFYADMPKTLDEIQATELKYLKLYEKNPFKTDLKYLLKIMKNILIKKARSQ